MTLWHGVPFLHFLTMACCLTSLPSISYGIIFITILMDSYVLDPHYSTWAEIFACPLFIFTLTDFLTEPFLQKLYFLFLKFLNEKENKEACTICFEVMIPSQIVTYYGTNPSKFDGGDVKQLVYGLNFLWTLMPSQGASKFKENPVPTGMIQNTNPSVHFCHFLPFQL